MSDSPNLLSQAAQTAANEQQPKPVPPSGGQNPANAEQPIVKVKKRWTPADTKRFVAVAVSLPLLYPEDEFEPWEFKLRYALSKEQDEKRQDFLATSLTAQEAKFHENALDEICDLLIELPTGFGDLNSEGVTVSPQTAGSVFKQYVKGINDKEAREQVNAIVFSANNQYWNTISPRPFRRKV